MKCTARGLHDRLLILAHSLAFFEGKYPKCAMLNIGFYQNKLECALWLRLLLFSGAVKGPKVGT